MFIPRIYPRFASKRIDEPKGPGPVGSVAAGFPPSWEPGLPASAVHGVVSPFANHLPTLASTEAKRDTWLDAYDYFEWYSDQPLSVTYSLSPVVGCA